MKLSTTYKTQSGDTFDVVSRKVYGTESESGRILRANPGIIEPLNAGTELIIPALPNSPKNSLSSVPSDNENEVTILIDGERFRFWTSVSVLRVLDSMDTVTFNAPFESDNKAFREIFKPFSYKSVEIQVGGDPLFTGTMINVDPVVEDSKTVQVQCYSLPGVLNDCTPPAGLMPELEFTGSDLSTIANILAGPFGVSVEFLEDSGGPFDTLQCEPTRKVLNFLTGLAKQRNLIISSSPRGALTFQKSAPAGRPVARLAQGKSPLISVTPTFNPQDYYSHITGLEPTLYGLKGSTLPVRNKRLSGVLRPFTFTVPDSPIGGLQQAVDAKLSRMFGNSVSYSVEVATWRDPQGDLWQPNTTLKLEAPDAMIYNEYEFLIRSVQFDRTNDNEKAVLALVLPGAFSGEQPETLPWDS